MSTDLQLKTNTKHTWISVEHLKFALTRLQNNQSSVGRSVGEPVESAILWTRPRWSYSVHQVMSVIRSISSCHASAKCDKWQEESAQHPHTWRLITATLCASTAASRRRRRACWARPLFALDFWSDRLLKVEKLNCGLWQMLVNHKNSFVGLPSCCSQHWL